MKWIFLNKLINTDSSTYVTECVLVHLFGSIAPDLHLQSCWRIATKAFPSRIYKHHVLNEYYFLFLLTNRSVLCFHLAANKLLLNFHFRCLQRHEEYYGIESPRTPHWTITLLICLFLKEKCLWHENRGKRKIIFSLATSS